MDMAHDALARRDRARQAVLVQVNCSNEPQKGGVEPDALPALLDGLRPLDRLDVRGLMTMAALTADAAEQRGAFRLLTNRPQVPTADEIATNPRARSAKLRIAERLAA